MTELTAWLFVLLQRIVPKRMATAMVHRIARIRTHSVKNFLIRHFIRIYDVNVDEVAASIPDGFDNFNSFFTRALRDGSRPVDDGADSIVSPVDGTVSAAGDIEKEMLFQAKGFRYSIADLLATDLQDSDKYTDGLFATIYLAPFNYHRIHAPVAGTLRAARYVPGQLFSVNSSTVSRIPGLFARNERLVCHFDAAHGPYVLIFVGALNVGSISTPWTGQIRPRKHGVVDDCELSRSDASRDVDKGDLLGWFNMGSTVIMLLPQGSAEWSQSLTPDTTLRMGEAIGRFNSSSDG